MNVYCSKVRQAHMLYIRPNFALTSCTLIHAGNNHKPICCRSQAIVYSMLQMSRHLVGLTTGQCAHRQLPRTLVVSTCVTGHSPPVQFYKWPSCCSLVVSRAEGRGQSETCPRQRMSSHPSVPVLSTMKVARARQPCRPPQSGCEAVLCEGATSSARLWLHRPHRRILQDLWVQGMPETRDTGLHTAVVRLCADTAHT